VLDALNRPFQRAHQQLSIIASMGIVEVLPDDTLESAIHHADIAMYEGRHKKEEENCWYTDELGARILKKSTCLASLN